MTAGNFDAFPDVELCVKDLLEILPGRCGTETPADLADHLPFHRITCIGGDDDTLSDFSQVDIDTFDADKAGARDAAEAVRQLVMATPHTTDHGVIDRATTTTKPHEAPWGDAAPRRYTATYRVSARR